MKSCLRRPAVLVLDVTVLLAAACGSPERPSEPSPTLTITSPKDVLRVGESVDVVLEAAFSDGRTTVITPLWGTDRPDVIHVKPLSASRQGGWEGWDQRPPSIDHMLFARITALAVGEAMITAQTQYGTIRRPIRVVAG